MYSILNNYEFLITSSELGFVEGFVIVYPSQEDDLVYLQRSFNS